MPLRIITGVQGSGKSTLERFLISELKKLNYEIIIINPETNPTVWGGVKVCADTKDINNFLDSIPFLVSSRVEESRELNIDEDDYLEYLDSGKSVNKRIAIFFMETNTYEAHGVIPKLLSTALKQCLTNIRKWGIIVTITAHSDNQTSISSALKGFSNLINTMPSIECLSTTSDTGEVVGSGVGLLRLKGLKEDKPLEIELINYPKTKKF